MTLAAVVAAAAAVCALVWHRARARTVAAAADARAAASIAREAMTRWRELRERLVVEQADRQEERARMSGANAELAAEVVRYRAQAAEARQALARTQRRRGRA